jgi:hypothetical protein
VRSTRDISNDSLLVAPLPNFDAFALAWLVQPFYSPPYVSRFAALSPT